MDASILAAYAVNVAVAAAILIVGYVFAGWAGSAVKSMGERNERVDNTLASFFGSIIRYAILAMVAIAVLDRFGVETTSLVALIGAAGLAIGLALQGTLSNLAAGVMLIMFRPFKVGDYVDAGGHSGTVKGIALFTTELATVDNVQIIMPNGAIWGSPIVNYSAHDDRRVDLVFGVSYDSDLKVAEQAINDVIAADQRVKDAPAAPFVAVTNLGDSSVDFTVRVWCDAADYWMLKFDLTRAVKEKFDATGVDIPFPTTTVMGVAASASASIPATQ
ncbi:MAG: mechanosensitive ion channel domain-containing protein [Pseudomonadota bacterium]